LIYSAITLQHISDKKIIEKFLSEFIRIVKPQGYIIFSLPTVKAYSFLKEKLLAFRGYIFNFLILLCSPNYIYTFLKISPYMKMNSLTSKRVINIYNKEADLLETELPGTINTRYFFKKKKLKANE
jgi:ubiquinone/menaquinone biosynthesis C-methylase UbiE